MKKLWIFLFTLSLLLTCFAACTPTDSDPKDTVGSETESETETTSAESPKPVRFDQADIPGTRLEFELLSASRDLSFDYDPKAPGKVLNQEECQIALRRAGRTLDSVDLNAYRIIQITACYGYADVGNYETADGFGVNEVILQEDRLVVVYESMYDVPPGGLTAQAISSHTSYIIVKVSDLPQGDFEFVICGYSSINPEYSCNYLNHYYE